MPKNARYCFVAAVLATAAGIVASVVITAIVRHSESDRLRVRFEDIANHRIRSVEGSLQTCVNHVEAVQAYLESEDAVGSEQFRNFTRHFLDRESYITAIEWVPAVTAAQRSAFEAGLRRHGNADFAIVDAHTRPHASAQDVCFPVVFSEPRDANRASIGVDYRSDPRCWEAMRVAMQNGRAQATRSLPLSGEAERSGVQIFMPVYAPAARPGAPAPSRACRGFVSVVFRTDAMTEYALANLEIAGVDVSFYEYDPDGSEHLLCTRWSRARPDSEQRSPGLTPAQRQTFERRGYAVSHGIKTAGLTWWVTVTPAPAFFTMFESRNWRLVLLVGIAMSMVIGYVVLVTLRFLTSREERARLHLAAVVESSADAIYTKNLSGIVTSWNRAAERLFGFSAAEIVGRPVSLIVPDAGLQESSALVEGSETGPRVRQYETVRITKAGKLINVSLSVSPIRDERGETVEAAVIAHDITERKHVERMKDDFAHLASHQLRTPLSAVRLYTEMLLDGYAGELSPLQREYLNIVGTSTRHMVDLVGTLLNISRIESSSLMVRTVPGRLDSLLGDALNEMEARITARHLRLGVDIEAGLPEVPVDTVVVHEILANLLSNAIKYTAEGGAVDVVLRFEGGQFVTIIADTGCGIPAEDHERVFSRFYRGSNVVSHEQEGSGMGLYLVKSLCDMSGCSITFESEEGRGTTFRFMIPATGMTERSGRSQLEQTVSKERLEHV